MSYNLVKNFNTITHEDTVVLDSNEIIAQKLQIYRETHPVNQGGFQAGLAAKQVDVVEGEGGLSREAGEDEEFEGEVEVPLDSFAETPGYDGPDPNELLADAQEQIEQMKQQAMAEIEEEKERIFEEARKKGYDAGFEQGNRDGLQRTEKDRQALTQEKLDFQAEYERLIAEIEPTLIDALNDIYQYIFKVDMTSYKDIVTYLVMNSLAHIEASKSYLIHVAKDDYAYMSMQKKLIQTDSVIGNADIEFAEDASLKKGQCLIETESGIYDCGLDTQLAELSRKLKILSYERQ